MDLTKEILLVKDLLSDKNDINDNLIQLVKEVCDGLYHPLSEKEKNVLKTKLNLFFLLATLNHQKTNQLNISIYFPSLQSAKMSWNSLFDISLRSSVLDSLFFVVFSEMPDDVICLVMANYCLEITRSQCCHDQVVSLCILTSNLLHHPNKQAEEHADQLMQTLLAMYDRCPNKATLADYHLSGMQQALQLLDSKASVSFSSADNFEISHLKKLQHLSEDSVKDIISDLHCHSDLVQTLNSFTNKEKTKSFVLEKIPTCLNHYVAKLDFFISQYFQVLADSPKSCTNMFDSYNDILSLYKKRLKTLQLHDSELLDSNENKMKSPVKSWNFESALCCALNLLDDYDEAVKFLFDFMLNCPSMSDAHHCLTALSTVPECMIRTCHVISLCKIIHLYQKRIDQNTSLESLKAAYELLQSVYQLLPLNSKLALLKQRCTPCFFFYMKLKLYASHEALNRKVNLVFNKITKTTSFEDYDDFLNSVCNIAFIDPHLSLVKIVDQIAFHKEHHSLLLKLLESLPHLVLMKSEEDTNNLVVCLVAVLKRNQSENTTNNICDFISLLLLINANDRNFAVFMAEQFLFVATQFLKSWNVYISSNMSVVVAFAFKSIKCISTQLSNVNLFPLFVIVHILACIVDEASGVMPDVLYAQAKSHLVDVVAIVSHRISQKEIGTEKLYQWLEHLSSCLFWTTKLYLRPILQNCSEHSLSIPASIQSICTLPQAEKLFFDLDYGEGTGLTVWLQCLIINPDLFSISSLKVNDLSVKDQQWLKHGMVVALSQVLPFCLDDDWHVVVEAMKGLLNQNYLFVAYPTNRMKTFPLLNLRRFRTSLCLLELMHCVSIILLSSCCTSWMSDMLWTRYAKCYAVTVKNLFFDPSDVKKSSEENHEHLFFVSQLFFYLCDFLKLLESIANIESACEPVHVLLLDLVTVFCSMHGQPVESEEVYNCNLMHDLLALKSHFRACASGIKNIEIQSALNKKLTSLD